MERRTFGEAKCWTQCGLGVSSNVSSTTRQRILSYPEDSIGTSIRRFLRVSLYFVALDTVSPVGWFVCCNIQSKGRFQGHA